MDSKAILDYALFQLTPTRTRCELLVFRGTVHEKIASGLFEPFVSHLKFAKDEILKGGYSIKLLPPTNGALWFSKATFQSTPAVLERFVTIEKEIQQIESSFQAIPTPDEGIMPQTNGNARSLSDSTKVNGELEGVDNKEEENSKVSLQRLLESRIALLRKEQAMAYTRGLVAGFEIDNIDDLIYFANAFGARRLREACINFKELWKKKHADDLWMKEVASMQSCLPPVLSFSGTSGIILANDITAHDQNNKVNSSKDGSPAGDEKNVSLETSNSVSTTNSATLNKKEDVDLPTKDQIPSHMANVQMPMPWPYNVPPYMYSLQNPLQQMPSYQRYPLTNMQSVPASFLNNMQWSSNMGVNQKPPATKREKSQYKKGSEEYEDQQSESIDPDSDSGSESNSDEQHDLKHSSRDELKRKKHRRKSSGTVVIRNINYYTPKRRNGNEDRVSDESSLDDDDDVINEETIKRKVNDALESLQKVHKVEKHANGKKSVACHIVNKSSDSAEQDLTENSSDAYEGGNKNEDWDAFQNLLKIDEGTGIDGSEKLQPIDVQDEHFMVRNSGVRMSYADSSSPDLDFKEIPKNLKVNDSFIVTHRDGGNEGESKLDEYVDNCGPVIKSRDYTGEEILFSHKSEESGNELGDPLSTCVSDSLVKKGRIAEDWFVVDSMEKMRSPDPPIVPTVFDGDCILSSVDNCSHVEKRSEGTLIDDSFMIQGQLVDNSLSDSQWKTDISVVADLTSSSKLESDTATSNGKHALSNNQEPNDLCVVLQRDTGLDSVEALRTMDYEIDFSFSEADRRSSIDDSCDNVNNKIPVSPKVSGTRNSEKSEALHGSSKRGKPEIVLRIKKPSPLSSRPVVQKSKREQEEEIRKKMEQLRIERQKRIAERTAASGLARATPRKDQQEGKTARISTRSDKNKTQTIKEMNRISSVKVRAI